MHAHQAASFIFPAATPTGHISEHKERRTRLLKWGGDLRQTYRTVGQAAGVGPVDIHLLMNHKLSGVSEGYITPAALLPHLLEQQERISRAIMKLKEGG